MEINTLRELKEIYSSNEGLEKWLLLSTGGYHGTYLTLDDVESILIGESAFSEAVNGKYWITVLLVYPERGEASEINVRYGDVAVELDDIQWLRERVRESIDKICFSQEGNV